MALPLLSADVDNDSILCLVDFLPPNQLLVRKTEIRKNSITKKLISFLERRNFQWNYLKRSRSRGLRALAVERQKLVRQLCRTLLRVWLHRRIQTFWSVLKPLTMPLSIDSLMKSR
jgi:hypothetical protein